eukprot:GHVL01014679.1.p1 GENE.GHVL01014679.1~~GHVL01014679.1.p1  ORF type:complete len:138 (+),score=14.30 GHVL01014679.1:96-509(+)
MKRNETINKPRKITTTFIQTKHSINSGGNKTKKYTTEKEKLFSSFAVSVSQETLNKVLTKKQKQNLCRVALLLGNLLKKRHSLTLPNEYDYEYRKSYLIKFHCIERKCTIFGIRYILNIYINHEALSKSGIRYILNI